MGIKALKRIFRVNRLTIKGDDMLKLMVAVFSLSLLLAYTQPVTAQEESTPASEAQSIQGQDEDPGMNMSMGVEQDPDMGMMPGMDGAKGMTCSPGCRCDMCMKKKMGMMGMKNGVGMQGMMCMKGGMAGMCGDIDMMTWPRIHQSCRLPDFYLKHQTELGLSDEQVDALQRALVSVQKEAILKGAQVKALELELSDMVTRPDFKLQEATAKLKEVEDARQALRSAMLGAAASARDSLSPEQLKKLKDLTRGGLGAGCCGKSMEMPMDKGGVPEDMKQNMMEKMQ